jgi:hypothetical protein
MALKVGDTVRYLNAVGGGRVMRISDGIAYVDDDGFETPVQVRECVVIGNSHVFGNGSQPIPSKEADKPAKKTQPAPSKPTRDEHNDFTSLPIVETAGGNVLNIVLGFEPVEIKALSQTDFDAYIVNDSNYYIFVSVMTRENSSNEWTPRYDGVIEPNIQEFTFSLHQSDLPHLDRICVQYAAFKRDRDFEAKAPGSVEFKIDATKFARLHCFRPNTYFDSPVIAFEINVNDRLQHDMPEIDPAQLRRGIQDKKREERRNAPAQSKSSKPSGDIIVVDLHASELLDTTAGLSPADILNLQIDRFTEVMQQNIRYIGQKIVFIHGKGEGVLRQAIMKELNHRFKGHDVQDASFREYGFGATQVTIRSLQPTNTAKKRR